MPKRQEIQLSLDYELRHLDRCDENARCHAEQLARWQEERQNSLARVEELRGRIAAMESGDYMRDAEIA